MIKENKFEKSERIETNNFEAENKNLREKLDKLQTSFEKEKRILNDKIQLLKSENNDLKSEIDRLEKERFRHLEYVLNKMTSSEVYEQ